MGRHYKFRCLEAASAVFFGPSHQFALALETALGSFVRLARVRGSARAFPDAFPSLHTPQGLCTPYPPYPLPPGSFFPVSFSFSVSIILFLLPSFRNPGSVTQHAGAVLPLVQYRFPRVCYFPTHPSDPTCRVGRSVFAGIARCSPFHLLLQKDCC